MYRNSDSLYCVTGTNSVVGQLHLKNKQTNNSQKKRSDLWLPEEGKWMKAVRRYKLPVLK